MKFLRIPTLYGVYYSKPILKMLRFFVKIQLESSNSAALEAEPQVRKRGVLMVFHPIYRLENPPFIVIL